MSEIPEGVRLHPRGEVRGSTLTFHRFRNRVSKKMCVTHHQLILVLNLQGCLELCRGSEKVLLDTGHGGFVASWRDPIQFYFEKGSHQFIILQVDRPRLKVFLESRDQDIPQSMQLWLAKSASGLGPVDTGAMSRHDLENAERLIYPLIAPSCLDLWYHGKIIELLCSMAFSAGDEVAPQWVVDRNLDGRIQEASSWVRKNFSEAITLGSLAREVGCSPTYLSRQFKQETGKTISAYVREIRIREAAEYFKRGTHNVTEAAYDVGYASLGQFSNAFSRVIGMSPQKYLMKNRSSAKLSRGSSISSSPSS